MSLNSIIQTKFLDGKGGCFKDKPVDSDNPVSWHHFNYSSTQAKSWLKKQSNISTQARTILTAAETRPRLVVEDDSIIMCLRGINMNSDQSPEDMITIRLWINDNTVITSCGRGSRSIANLQAKLTAGEGPKTVPQLLNDLLEQLALLTDEFIDSLEAMLDKEEDMIAELSFDVVNPRMSQIRRQLATIKRYLAPQKEALEKLYRSKAVFLNEGFYDQLYVHIDKFIYILENLDLLRERALVLQEQFMAYISHQQNSRLYLLAIISAIFLPLTFLSGLLGMNVGGLPGVETESAFWVVSGFCLIVTVLLLLWFKKSKWF